MKCPKCQKEITKGMKFCTGCGAKLSETVKCENCGKILSPEIKFCTGCGSKVKKEEAPNEEPKPVTPPTPEPAVASAPQTVGVPSPHPVVAPVPQPVVTPTPQPQFVGPHYQTTSYPYAPEPKRRSNAPLYILLSIIILAMGVFAYFFFSSTNQKEIAEDSQAIGTEPTEVTREDSHDEVVALQDEKPVPSSVEAVEEVPAYNEDTYNQISVGAYNGYANDSYPFVMEVNSSSGNRFEGNIYYESSVRKYGRNSDTLMPFHGKIDGDNIQLKVGVNSNPSYSEEWNLKIGSDSYYGSMFTSEGKSWTIKIYK